MTGQNPVSPKRIETEAGGKQGTQRRAVCMLQQGQEIVRPAPLRCICPLPGLDPCRIKETCLPPQKEGS